LNRFENHHRQPQQQQFNNFQRWNFNQFQPDFREFQPSGDYYFQPFQAPFSPTLPISSSLIPLYSSCPQVKFYNRSDDKLFGKIDLTVSNDLASVELEIEFDEFIPVFAVSFPSIFSQTTLN
jgi:hypothetical protein